MSNFWVLYFFMGSLVSYKLRHAWTFQRLSVFKNIVLWQLLRTKDWQICALHSFFLKTVIETKKCFRLDDMLDLKILWNFQTIWSCFGGIIKKIRKPIASLVFPSKLMLPFWNLQKITSSFITAKPTLTGSLKFLWHGFLKTIAARKKRRQIEMVGFDQS